MKIYSLFYTVPQNRYLIPGFRYKKSLQILIASILIISGFSIYAQQAPTKCLTAESSFSSSGCAEGCFFNMPPDNLPNLPLINLNVEFYFVETNGNNPHCDPNGPADTYAPNVVQEILDAANAAWTAPEQNAFGSSPQVPDTRVRYVLSGDPQDPCHGIHLVTQTPSSYNPNVYPIIVTGDGTTVAGSNSGTSTTLLNIHSVLFASNNTPLSKWGPLLNHEMGHQFGLCHAFSTYNTCPDMDPSAECGSPGSAYCNSTNPPTPCGPNTPDPSGAYPLSCGFNQCFECYCTWGNGNNMMGYNGSQKGLTMSQWAQIYGSLLTDRPAWALIETLVCSDLPASSPIVIPGGVVETWDYLRVLDKSVEVQSGGTLIIKCEVWMGKDLPIIVKRGGRLIVEGGKITSWDLSCRWGGIKVQGNAAMAQPDPGIAADPNQSIPGNGAGVVYLNGAVLENAATAVSTTGSGSQSSSDYFGGLVMVYGTNFINNGRAIEFMQYPYENKSYISYSFIERKDPYPPFSVNRGVSIWACHGIEFYQTHFNGTTDYGILAADATADVSYCSFSKSIHGIKMEFTMPNVVQGQFNIENSQFSLNTYDIHILGSTGNVYPLNISNNTFLNGKSTGDFGIYMIGESAFNIEYNVFEDKTISNIISSTGGYFNTIDCNYYRNNIVGINVAYKNNRLTMSGNQFPVDFGTEIRIQGSTSVLGEINPFQSNNTAAGNCFAGTTNAIVATQNSTVPFRYRVLSQANPNFDPCLVPTNNLSDGGTNNYYIESSLNVNYDCNRGGEQGEYAVSDLENVKALKSQQERKMASEPEQSSLLNDYLTTAKLQEEILRSILSKAWESGDYQTMDALLLQENSQEAYRSLAGLMVQRGDYNSAHDVLAAMPVQTQDDRWFKEMMDINIEAAQQREHFSLNVKQENLLQTIAGTPHSIMSGYACAMLSRFKGYACEPQIPADVVIAEERNQENTSNGVKVYPNPTNGNFTLEYQPLSNQNYQLDMFDQNGRNVLHMTLPAQNKVLIPAADLPAGFYWVRVLSEKSVVYSGKVVLTN